MSFMHTKISTFPLLLSTYSLGFVLSRFSYVRLFVTLGTVAPTPGSCVHGILQARILEWVASPSSRGSSQPRIWIRISCIAGRFFTHWGTWEALILPERWVKTMPLPLTAWDHLRFGAQFSISSSLVTVLMKMSQEWAHERWVIMRAALDTLHWAGN